MTAPLRLRLDGDALTANWRWLAKQSGAAACGAAVKANGYGLGAGEVVKRLAAVGCRDFFVATWDEADALGALPEGCALSVLHGVREEDMPLALSSPARPVLNTLTQVARWKAAGGGACDVMIDTGMNRLGLAAKEIGALDGLQIETLMSHLASADEDTPQNAKQLRNFAALAGQTNARRISLANSAGICLGRDYAFDLTRPGLALYGGIPTQAATDHIRQVAYVEAQVLQRRRIRAGEKVGYNATFEAERDMELAVVNLGYADGYLRGFSGTGSAGNGSFSLLGRVSMDLTIFDVSAQASIGEGDWMSIDYALPPASATSGLSQYELLTGLGARFARVWV